MKSERWSAWVVLLGVAIATGACSRPAPLSPLIEGTASRVVLMGNEQAGPAGAELPETVAVRVLDDRGEPVANQIVNFTVTGGGGEVFAGHSATDANGVAREWWTLGPAPGVNTLEARAIDGLGGNAIVVARFTALGL